MTELLKFFTIGLKSELGPNIIEIEDCGRFDERLSDYSVMCQYDYIFEIQEWIQMNVRKNAEHCARTLGINPSAVFRLIAVENQIYFTEEILKNYGGVERFLATVTSGAIEVAPVAMKEEPQEFTFAEETTADIPEADELVGDELVGDELVGDELVGDELEPIVGFDAETTPLLNLGSDVTGTVNTMEETEQEDDLWSIGQADEVQSQSGDELSADLEDGLVDVAAPEYENAQELDDFQEDMITDDAINADADYAPECVEADELQPVDLSDAVEPVTSSAGDEFTIGTSTIEADFEEEPVDAEGYSVGPEFTEPANTEAKRAEEDVEAGYGAGRNDMLPAAFVDFTRGQQDMASSMERLETQMLKMSEAMAMMQSYMLRQSSYGLQQDEILRDDERDTITEYLSRVSPYLIKDFFMSLAKEHKDLAELTYFFNLFAKYIEEVSTHE